MYIGRGNFTPGLPSWLTQIPARRKKVYLTYLISFIDLELVKNVHII